MKYLMDGKFIILVFHILLDLPPELIQNDVTSLMKVGIIIMIIILLLNLRNIYAVGLVFSVIILSLIGMMGFYGLDSILNKNLKKFYFTLLNSSMPILILTIANSDGVHVLTKFFKELRKSKNKQQAIYSTMNALMLPIFLTSLTTVTAFFDINMGTIKSINRLWLKYWIWDYMGMDSFNNISSCINFIN